jgi:hypothetical protein
MPGAIVSLVIGDAYLSAWRKHCQPNWQAYAERHGFDLIIFTEPLDKSESAGHRPLNWQKLLLDRDPRVKKHSNILWLDADVVVNPSAPNIFDGIPSGKVGAVRADVFFENPLLVDAFRRVTGDFASVDEYRVSMYTRSGRTAIRPYINTGVLAYRDFDFSILERIYETHRDSTIKFEEQIPLSYELAAAGLIHEVDPRFNVEWYCQKFSVYDFVNKFLPEMKRLYIAQALSMAYFLHFAGNRQDMEYYDPQVTVRPGRVAMSIDGLEAIAGQVVMGMPEERRNAVLAKIRNQKP